MVTFNHYRETTSEPVVPNLWSLFLSFVVGRGVCSKEMSFGETFCMLLSDEFRDEIYQRFSGDDQMVVDWRRLSYSLGNEKWPGRHLVSLQMKGSILFTMKWRHICMHFLPGRCFGPVYRTIRPWPIPFARQAWHDVTQDVTSIRIA